MLTGLHEQAFAKLSIVTLQQNLMLYTNAIQWRPCCDR